VARKYNLLSFILCLLLTALSLQSLYAAYNHSWSVAPPASILWLLTVITFFMGISGFRDKRSRGARWRSWLTVLIAFPLSAIFLLGIVVNVFAKELIATTQSPDLKTTIDFYTLNGGAATSISVVGIVDGPFWFKKNIYYDEPMHKADVVWINNHIITINNHTLNLDKGETFSD
jgi:O-antigen ligase